MKPLWFLILSVVFFSSSVPSHSELMMKTFGNITVAPYVHGFDKSAHTFPGFRSEFIASVDVFKWKRLIVTSLIGNTTVITKTDTTSLGLDKIRYTLTPAFRYDLGKWILRGSLHHECIHTIGKKELSGSIWWNSLQVGVGSKEAYYLYLRDEYRNINNSFINKWDGRIDVGYIIPAERTLFTGQNHDYHYEMFSLLRYHIGVFKHRAYFATLRHNLWVKSNYEKEHQINLTLNMFYTGAKNFAGFFYSYTFYDTFSLDNSKRLGAIGYRILF
jgi:hypothetical protein